MKLDVYGKPGDFGASGEYENAIVDGVLSQCPFCGGIDIEVVNTHTPHYTVICADCGAKKPCAIGSGKHFKSRGACIRAHGQSFRSAITEWNTRA